MIPHQRILKRKYIDVELNNMFNYPLTVVIASMGYGKTISTRNFLNEAKAKYIWLSLESEESSPQYIWDTFTRQLTNSMPELGNKLRELGFPDDSPQRDNIIKIIEDYTYMTNSVLVIDDYHFAHSPELNILIERIIWANIKGFYVVILSRTMPEIKIEELTVKGYCYVVKSNYFELDKREINDYFKLYGYNISDEMIDQVYSMSEGWVSAVYLIMQRYGKIGRLDTGRSVERLIETGVMYRYSDEEINVLKKLCVLDSFTPEQSSYVTGNKSTKRIIQDLSYGNSFIQYDEVEDIYRIHNIFNHYLKKILEEEPNNIDINVLYRRSGEWCINNRQIIQGLKYLLKAKEYDLIMSEFEKSHMSSVIDNNPRYILELFNSIPNEAKCRNPIAYLSYIGFYITNVDIDKGKELLTNVEKQYYNDDRLSTIMKNRIEGEIQLIRAYINFNDLDKMYEKLSKAHELLSGKSSIANRGKIATFGSPHSLYLYYREKGKMLYAVEALDKTFPYYMELADGCGIGFESQVRAEYYLETGQYKDAELYAYKSTYKARTLGQVSIIICSSFTLARLSLVNGKYNEALEIMDDIFGEVEACNSPILSSAYDLCIGYIAGMMMRSSNFPKWLKSGDIKQSEVLYQGMGFNYIVYGKYLLLDKEYIKLEVLCEEMQQVFSVFNNILGYLHCYILEAISKYKLYGIDEAIDAIDKALDIGRADNIILPFAEYSIYILDLLKLIQNQNDDKYIKELLFQVSKYYKNYMNVEDNSNIEISLTNREKEILNLIVKGNTNKEIATELFIAEVTVRKNITSIYRKLGVNRRAEAVKIALELKIEL